MHWHGRRSCAGATIAETGRTGVAILLGIDTGGTFTDAVLFDDTGSGPAAVVAKAKSLTTKTDLAIGIGHAVKAVLSRSPWPASAIGLVSLSTTLATNALIEGQGERVAFVAIGFDARDLQRAGLAEALGDDPVVRLPGGYTSHGSEVLPLDMQGLLERLEGLAGEVSGFAVAGYFAVRNPAQELAVRDALIERTGLPVTCSHELSSQLNGPKRALTTVLNARLIGMIDRLNQAAGSVIAESGIDAPLMVVRGDGALVSADFARRRPIETILSGPAASLVGGRFLTGASAAFVNDIGGTTSDIAMLENGLPRIDPDGARVGGHRTMVEAVAMHTFGLGGDSEVRLGGPALAPVIELGPRRLVPVSLLAHDHRDVVYAALDSQLRSSLASRRDGRFALLGPSQIRTGLTGREDRLLARLTDRPQALASLLEGNSEEAALNGLVGRGLAQVGGLTPSDALHVLDRQSGWDKEAARKALSLFGRIRNGAGQPFNTDPYCLAEDIARRVERRSADIILQTALENSGDDGELVHHALVRRILDRNGAGETQGRTVQFSLKLDRPVIGLGASAHIYHPHAAKLLGVDAIIPEHADVANAVGAVVGQVSTRAEVTVIQPEEGRFHVSGLEKPFPGETEAFEAAEQSARAQADALARQAGALEFGISVTRQEKRAEIEGRDQLVEAVFMARATGRPPIAG